MDAVVLLLAVWAPAGLFWLTLALPLLPAGVAAPDLFHFHSFVPMPSKRFWMMPFFWPFGAGFVLLGALLVLGSFTYFEGSEGRTLGKRVFRLRVLRAHAEPAGFREALLQNLVKVVPLLLLLDALLMVLFFANEKQRASDRLAETIAVEEG